MLLHPIPNIVKTFQPFVCVFHASPLMPNWTSWSFQPTWHRPQATEPPRCLERDEGRLARFSATALEIRLVRSVSVKNNCAMELSGLKISEIIGKSQQPKHQKAFRLGSVKVEHAIFFFFLCVPLFHLDSTITFQSSIVDQGWPRCFGRAPLLPASATVLRDANEFVAQIFQEMPIIKGISKREFVHLPWAIAFMPSISIRFFPSFSSQHPYTNLLPSNSSHHLAHKESELDHR